MIFCFLAFMCLIGTSNALNGQLTRYCSYPPCCNRSNISPPYTDAERRSCGQEECDDYSGCSYEGQFAYCGNKSHQWVAGNNIVTLFSAHGDQSRFINKMIRITQGDRSIEAKVCDTCGDSDCNGCCSRNAKPSGYLLDLEANTYARFGASNGAVTWECLNC